ncbi:Dap2p [Sugiyamaella lignohabitans]|uniref:Dap2p n=1 Tax=Sugiyamaella lignohabitans TaxID=796027 RepID=A0A167CK21_9ASCO|nr:Dap2p [Sugiyamaella lignohabitans]ANB11796.1 Dap2p [Sugiyamaella lignohabitans]
MVARSRDYEPLRVDDQGEIDSPRSSTSSILEKFTGHGRSESDAERQWRGESEFDYGSEPRPKKVKRSRLIVLAVLSVITLVLFVSTSVSYIKSSPSGSFRQTTFSGTVDIATGKKLLTLEELRTGAYAANHQSISWIEPIPSAKENLGDFVLQKDNKFLLSHWANRSDEKLIVENVVEIEGTPRAINSVTLNRDQTKAILSTDRKKNWRHSSFSLFWVLDLETREITPVNTKDSSRPIALAEWSPRGDRIAFVADNNIFLRYVGGEDDGTVKQITTDGGDEIFYGRPDWVYEEEVFSGSKALWWSLNGEYLAFLRTNDTEVPEFPIPYFVQHGDDGSDPYPELVNLKYPKPGFPNPIVNILFLEISTEEYYAVPVEENPAIDNLITEVLWTDNSKVILRVTSRESDILKISVVDAKTRTGKIVRSSDETGDDGGWFEVSQDTVFIPADPENGRPEEGYIDTIFVDGYNHLAFFSPVDSSEPKTILTRGEWEVTDVSSVDLKNNKVYFLSTKKSAVERQLYSVNLDGTGLTSVSDDSQDGYYRASFSADSRYVLLSYDGPEVPWQKVVDLHSESPLSHAETIESNSGLRDRLKDYALPKINHFQLKVATDEETGADIVANVKEILPASFNPAKKYPVLFFVYGGPGSQTVTKAFALDFQRILSGLEDIIVVSVDGRGTGFMGRKFRTVVRDKLGHFEPLDQITTAKYYASKPYVDAEHIAIWGWSYGGYMTLKTLETDAGQTFRYGMSVAPVTNWRFYDSVYTERYMHTPQNNPKGYAEAAIHNVTAIAQNERFLLMHGTGDDNVHVQNSLVLLDLFDQNNVENYDVHVFPDSDHSISFNNANTIIYDKLHHWITSAFQGKFKTIL